MSALRDVEGNLADRLVGVCRIHLVGALIAFEKAGRTDCITEWAVECARILGGVRHDLRIVVTRALQGRADRFDAAVHHVGWCEDVGAGFGLHEALPDERGDRLVVGDFIANQQAVMSVAGVGIERPRRERRPQYQDRFV